MGLYILNYYTFSSYSEYRERGAAGAGTRRKEKGHIDKDARGQTAAGIFCAEERERMKKAPEGANGA